MSQRLALVALGTASLMLPGCVAAVVPIAAAGAIGGKQVLQDDASAPPTAKQLAKAERRRLKEAEKLARSGGMPMVAAAPTAEPVAPSVPAGMQYLYASGEAAAVSLQSYLQLMNFLLAVSSDESIGHGVQSVVLAPGSTLAEGKFVPCGKKPLAMVLDIDETALLNLGFEGDQVAIGGAYDQDRWNAWEQDATPAQVAAVPGVHDALTVARRARIAVVFNSNRQSAYAAQTAALLAGAGLGPVVHRDTLWLQGDAGAGPGKDARRAAIAQKYCVVAMVGDQLGDFSDLFNAPGATTAERRRLTASREVLSLWGRGWFILPNPVYGSSLRGGMDDVFPPANRWTPPAPAPVQTPAAGNAQ